MRPLLLILAAGLCSGACTVDATGICVTGLSAIQDNLIGPLICYGCSPWIYGDLAESGVAQNMAPIAIAAQPALGTPLSGTFSWVTGNQFFTTSADQTAALAGKQFLVVAWDTVDGAATGRFLCPIGTVNSTQVFCNDGDFQQPTQSGKTAYLLPAAVNGCDFQCWTTENPQYTWGYYDAGIGITRLHYRTLNATYQTQGRAYADIMWQWVLDHGYRLGLAPRASAMISQFFRVGEGHTERLPGLYNWISIEVPRWADPATCPQCDNREAGYMLWNIALGAKVDTDPTRHTQYCSWLTTFTNTWNMVQAPDGSFPQDEYWENRSFVSAPKAFAAPFLYEGAPWRIAINVKSLEAAYESLSDTSMQGCSSPTLAASTLTTITKAVTWQNNYGRSTVNRGIFYEVNSQSNDQASASPAAGTVSINLASTSLLGSGTNWNTAGYCDGTHFVGISTPAKVYKIASCTDDTHATLTVPFGVYGETLPVSASGYGIAPAASSSCGASLATWCYTGAANGDRNLTRTVCGGMGWLYAKTLNPSYKTWTDECLSASLGGPTAGLTSAVNEGSIVLPCSGPACDGLVTDTVAAAANCNDTGNVPPCLFGVDYRNNLGKNFGEAFGAPGIDNALAWRLPAVASPVAPIITSLSPLPGGTVGTSYSYQFTATGTAPITWTGTGLPGWASLSSTGLLTGTPSAAASSSLAITATNLAGSAGPQTFSLTVVSSGVAPTITSTSPLPGGTTGTAYSYQFAANGTAPITWSAMGLPAWASLSTGGLITGLPNAAAVSTIQITATNGTGSAGPTPFSLTITAAPPVITCAPRTGLTPPNALDIQFQTNMALGTISCTNSLTGSGCTVVDVQRVINAALGAACVTGP